MEGVASASKDTDRLSLFITACGLNYFVHVNFSVLQFGCVLQLIIFLCVCLGQLADLAIDIWALHLYYEKYLNLCNHMVSPKSTKIIDIS